MPSPFGDELQRVNEIDCDGEEIFRRHAATLRTFVVRHKKYGTFTVRGQYVKGPYRGKSGTEYYAVIINESGHEVAAGGIFTAADVDGIEEQQASPAAAS
jgi:hypothetical protein